MTFARTFVHLVVGAVAAIPATYLTVLVYLYAARLGQQFVSDARFALVMGLMLLPRALVLAIPVALVVSTLDGVLSVRKFTLAFILLVFSAGACFGVLSAGKSPHISAPLAAASGAIAWLSVGQAVLIIRKTIRYRCGLTALTS